MYNVKTESYLAEKQREVLEFELEQRRLKHQLPEYRGQTVFHGARSWLSNHVLWPAVTALEGVSGDAGDIGRLYWRRGYTRVLGVIYNALVHLKDLVPGRPSMA